MKDSGPEAESGPGLNFYQRGKMKWNEAQLSAITEKEKNILVSAAAGSGKTAVLTERICRLVKEGTGIDEMLVVTFTNAAAGEMKERIGKAILDAMEEEDADTGRLQAQFDKINTANISTFHSFCYEVVRNYFFLTELTADFRLCDAIQEDIFARESMEEVLNEFFDRESPDFLRFLRRFSKPGNERGAAEMIEKTYKLISSLPEPEKWLEDSVEAIKNSEDGPERGTYRDACVLRDLTLRYREIFLDKKLKVNQLGFDDVQHFALRVLKNEEAAEEYRKKFEYIFIDEYQDTNGLQEAIISEICRENNLFMVGDVKQSIYRFRLAEPGLFINRYRKYREGTDPLSIKIDLNSNFRSKDPVITVTNRVMEEIMTEESCGLAYDEAAALREGAPAPEPEEGRPDGEFLSKGPVLDLILTNDIKDAMMEAVPDGPDRAAQAFAVESIGVYELEAHQICKRIKEILGQAYFDRKENRWKTIEAGDIVVLMRGLRAASQIYQEVFRKEGVPCYAEGGESFFDTAEIAVFTNLLRVISNRRQDIPLLSVLRMPCFDFSAEELAKIRINMKEGLFAEAFLKYADEGPDRTLGEKCVKVLSMLDRWRDLGRYIPLRDLVCLVSDETGYYDYVSTLYGGMRRRKNLETLFDIAEKYQKSTARSLSGFITYVEKLALDEADIPSGPAEDEGKNYVRIMTIHKSKGLEFPVVFIADTGRLIRPSREGGNLSLDKDEGLGLRFRSEDGTYEIKTERQDRVSERIKRDRIAEEMRLLYVAMTRAREKLYIVGSAKRDKNGDYLAKIEELPENRKCFLEWVYPCMEEMAGRVFGSDENGGEWSVEINRVSEPFEGLLAEVGVTDEPEPGLEAAVEAESGEESCQESGSEARTGAEERTGAEVEGSGEKAFEYRFREATTVPVKFTATELTRLAAAEKDEAETSEIEEAENLPKQLSIEDLLAGKAGEEKVCDAEGDSLSEENAGEGVGEVSTISGESAGEVAGTAEDGRTAKFTGAEKGSITHEVLQRLDLSRVGSRKEIETQIKEMVEAEKLTGEEASAVYVFSIDRFFRSDMGKRLLSAEKVYREKEFLLWNPCDEEAGSIIQGVIDCFFIEDGQVVIIDYKTDYIPDEGREEAIKKKTDYYRTQLEIYRQAVEEGTDYQVKEGWLCFIGAGGFSRVY